MSNKEKSEQLGMSFSTASGQLRKAIMFNLAQKCGMDRCYQCGYVIEDIDNFSIEHKIPWMHSENPVELFFDVDNIAFSHHKCNVGSARHRFAPRTKSGLKGVSFSNRKAKPYRAMIRTTDGNINLGSFETAEEAGIAYDEKAVELFGDRAVTNKMLGLL